MEQLYKSFYSIAYYINMGGETPKNGAEFQTIIDAWYKMVRPEYSEPVRQFINKYGIEVLMHEINEIV